MLTLPFLEVVDRHVQIANQIVEFLEGHFPSKDSLDFLRDRILHQSCLIKAVTLKDSLMCCKLGAKLGMKSIFCMQSSIKVLYGSNYALLVFITKVFH